MSLQNRVLFGLKVAFNFSDAESKTTALQNLGLDLRDLDVIRGITPGIDKVIEFTGMKPTKNIEFMIENIINFKKNN